MPASILQAIKDAGMPGFSGFESDFETDPTVGIRGLSGLSQRGDRHRSAEIPVAIDGAQPLPPRRPLRRDPTATDDAVGFHLEDVRKVAPDGALKLESYRLHVVVGDIEILVQSPIDPS